jgi:hypothetical protein
MPCVQSDAAHPQASEAPHGVGRGLQEYVVDVEPQHGPTCVVPLGHMPASSGGRHAPPETVSTTQICPCEQVVLPQGMPTHAHPSPTFVQV